MAKNLVLGPILTQLAQIRAANFLIKRHLVLPLIRYGQLSSCTISEKTNDPILRKLGGGRTDGQTDESDFIGRCTTNVKRSKGNFILKNTEHSIMICGNTNNYIRKNSWQV